MQADKANGSRRPHSAPGARCLSAPSRRSAASAVRPAPIAHHPPPSLQAPAWRSQSAQKRSVCALSASPVFGVRWIPVSGTLGESHRDYDTGAPPESRHRTRCLHGGVPSKPRRGNSFSLAHDPPAALGHSPSNRYVQIVESLATHRKQGLATQSNRYTSRTPAMPAFRPLNFDFRVPSVSSSHSPLVTSHQLFLPATPPRVESLLTCRKQTPEVSPTRNSVQTRLFLDFPVSLFAFLIPNLEFRARED